MLSGPPSSFRSSASAALALARYVEIETVSSAELDIDQERLKKSRGKPS